MIGISDEPHTLMGVVDGGTLVECPEQTGASAVATRIVGFQGFAP